METRVFFDHLRGHLVEKWSNLATWLRSAPAPERNIRLGLASEQAVQTRLESLETAIEKAEGQTLPLSLRVRLPSERPGGLT